jgi:hypothetical protein
MSMPELKWYEADFIECLEVLPEWSEYCLEALFEVERDGLTLKVSVRPWDSIVHVHLCRPGSETPLIGLELLVLGQVEVRKDDAGDYIRFHEAIPALNRFDLYDHCKGTVVRTRSLFHRFTVTLMVNPDIRVELESELA